MLNFIVTFYQQNKYIIKIICLYTSNFFYPFTNTIHYLCILKSTKRNFLVHLDVTLTVWSPQNKVVRLLCLFVMLRSLKPWDLLWGSWYCWKVLNDWDALSWFNNVSNYNGEIIEYGTKFSLKIHLTQRKKYKGFCVCFWYCSKTLSD
jgi:hypothetical protein